MVLDDRAHRAAGAARRYSAHVKDELMPEYSVITGCLVLPGMETQGRLLSVSGTHAGTGTNETRSTT